MNEEDFKLWTEIRPTKTASYYQRVKLADLMTKYYGVKYQVPCACPASIRQIINELDKLNESRTD
jgi:hypothetical protein